VRDGIGGGGDGHKLSGKAPQPVEAQDWYSDHVYAGAGWRFACPAKQATFLFMYRFAKYPLSFYAPPLTSPACISGTLLHYYDDTPTPLIALSATPLLISLLLFRPSGTTGCTFVLSFFFQLLLSRSTRYQTRSQIPDNQLQLQIPSTKMYRLLAWFLQISAPQ